MKLKFTWQKGAVKFPQILALLTYAIHFSIVTTGASTFELENELGKPLILIVRTEIASPLARYRVSSVEFAFWKSGLSYCASLEKKWVNHKESDISKIILEIDDLSKAIEGLIKSKIELGWQAYDFPYKKVYINSNSQTNLYTLTSSLDGIPEDMGPGTPGYQEFLKVWRRALTIPERFCR